MPTSSRGGRYPFDTRRRSVLERCGSRVNSQRDIRRPESVGLGGRRSLRVERAHGHAELGQDVGIGNLRCRPHQSEQRVRPNR